MWRLVIKDKTIKPKKGKSKNAIHPIKYKFFFSNISNGSQMYYEILFWEMFFKYTLNSNAFQYYSDANVFLKKYFRRYKIPKVV